MQLNSLNAELNPICHLLALLGGATIVVVSRLRVNIPFMFLFFMFCMFVFYFVCSVILYCFVY
jgi:hypothetical protein